MQDHNPLTLEGSYAANPHLYGYLHRLSFLAKNKLVMLSGTKQELRIFYRGRYVVYPRDHDTAFVLFTDLEKITPYRDTSHALGFAPFEIRVIRETGVFAFLEQVVWGTIKREEDWPCLVFREKYTFEKDPFEYITLKKERYMYRELSEEEEDTRSYYHVDSAELFTQQEAQHLRNLFEQGLLP